MKTIIGHEAISKWLAENNCFTLPPDQIMRANSVKFSGWFYKGDKIVSFGVVGSEGIWDRLYHFEGNSVKLTLIRWQ
jgi:hypothetical protein